MTILSGDIKLLASKIMDDVPNGGGGPTGTVIPDGASNAIFGDVTERARAGGSVSIRQLHLAVQTDDTSAFMDPSIIVSVPPNDANVSITLAKCDTFALRTAIANTIENYLIAGPVWPGYLFEGHVIGQRSIQLFQRPGTPAPNVGYTLALVYDEGKPGERKQFVRITRVETVSRLFAGVSNVPFLADIVSCELTDALRFDFPGSPPSEAFARQSTSTLTRDTTVANAAQFYGISTLTAAASVGDNLLRVASVYTQLVPSTRTESAALDQKPAAQRRLTLAQSPRLIEVGVTPHTMRIRVGQENRGFAWVQMLKPRPAPGTIVISYMALGNWYTLMDDGAGGFTGAGVGQVIYTTGSLSITLPSMPDAGTSIIFQWGENTAYTSRAGQAGYRAPEFAWALPHQGVKPASVVVTWMSKNVLKTATDNGSGAFAGDAVGEVDYAAGKIYLRPTAMIDAGGEFQTAYEYTSTRTETFAGVAPDAGGFASLTLSEVPAAKSVAVRWITTRTVSASSGTSSIVSTAAKGADVHTVIVDPPQPSGNTVTPSSHYTMPGQDISFKVTTVAPQTMGTYHWEISARTPSGAEVDASLVLGGATTGTFSVTNNWVFGVAGSPDPSGSPGTQNYPVGIGMGKFVLTIAADCPDLLFRLSVKNQALTTIAVTPSITVDAVGDNPAVPWVDPPPPVIVVRDPDIGNATAQPLMEKGGLHWQDRTYVYVRVVRIYLATGSIYADADGMGYDLPEVLNTLVVWSPSDLAAGFKTITSTAGVPTVYHLWK